MEPHRLFAALVEELSTRARSLGELAKAVIGVEYLAQTGAVEACALDPPLVAHRDTPLAEGDLQRLAR